MIMMDPEGNVNRPGVSQCLSKHEHTEVRRRTFNEMGGQVVF